MNYVSSNIYINKKPFFIFFANQERYTLKYPQIPLLHIQHWLNVTKQFMQQVICLHGMNGTDRSLVVHVLHIKFVVSSHQNTSNIDKCNWLKSSEGNKCLVQYHNENTTNK